MATFDKIVVTMISGVVREFYGTARVNDGVLYITGPEYKANTTAIPLAQIDNWETVWR